MNVPICTLAEFAVIRPSKKLDIICATNLLLAQTFPAKLSPDTYIAARLQAESDECELAYVVGVKVKGPYGGVIFQTGHLVKFDIEEPALSIALSIGGSDVPCGGTYTISIHLNDEEIAYTTFEIREA